MAHSPFQGLCREVERNGRHGLNLEGTDRTDPEVGGGKVDGVWAVVLHKVLAACGGELLPRVVLCSVGIARRIEAFLSDCVHGTLLSGGTGDCFL